ncbi:MAG: iron-containing alcohol dehydrogenase [Planctomycetaceae bacterium]|nr:iron-containing alcohol dehydrogenase [Planctomycetaceae bacterium]
MTIREQVYGFYMPGITLIGIGAHKEIPNQFRILGAGKPLIVADKGVTACGITKTITDLLDEAGIAYIVFDETVPNPTDKNVHDGVGIYMTNQCDSLITLGGGSAHDCGKGIGLVVAGGGKIADYEGLDKSGKPFPPYLAVNTTAGTASEMTRFCIITDTSRKVKMAIVDWRVTPAVAINDPLLMVGMPQGLTAATGMDALTHAVEAYISTLATPMTDTCAEKAVELIFLFLRRAVANGNDMEARDMMTYAEYLAGMAFNNASLGYVHAMAHQLGGFYDLPHGECNAVLLPHVQKFNLIARIEKFAKLAMIMGEDINGCSDREAADVCLDAIRKLSEDIGIPNGLVALGKKYGKEVSKKDIPTMVANAMKDACGATNPRTATAAEIAGIYEEAM